MRNIIEIEGLSHNFGRKQVLKDINLCVPRGIVMAVLGENGAGKTTMIKSLLGYLKPNKGKIRVLGLEPRKDAVSLKRLVGYVPDQAVVQPWMTVNQVCWFVSAFYEEGYVDRFTKIANGFSLPANAKFKTLSKGMKAKVSLTIALAMNPELLVLDEPTAGLDPIVRRTFLEEMVDRAAEGKTVWINSHQVDEVERIADWIAIIQGGRLCTCGSLSDLKQKISTVTITTTDPVLPLPEILRGPECLLATPNGRQWKVLVENWNDEKSDQVNTSSSFQISNVCQPTLEDIYIAYSCPDKNGIRNQLQLETTGSV